MKGIFKNPFFIITLTIAVLLSSGSLVMRLYGKMSFVDNAVGSALMPAEKASSAVVTFFRGIGQYFDDYNTLKNENEALKKQIKEMTEDVEESDQLRRENEWLYKFLDLKRSHTDYVICNASVISYSQVKYLASFTIDKGSDDGIGKGMPIITEDGLAGCITEVGNNFSVCISTENPSFSIGAYTEHQERQNEVMVTVVTSENCYATGNFNDASKSQLRLNYLADDHKIQIGDIVKTTGVGGIYPRGIVIGTVSSIEVDKYSQTMYAVVDVAVDVTAKTNVMVITDFEGRVEGGK